MWQYDKCSLCINGEYCLEDQYFSKPFPMSIIQQRAEINVELVNNYYNEYAIIDDENAH
jgi:hypothetical protein